MPKAASRYTRSRRSWAKAKAKLAKKPRHDPTYLPDGTKATRHGDVFKNPNSPAAIRRSARGGESSTRDADRGEFVAIRNKVGGTLRPQGISPTHTAYPGSIR